MYVIYQVLRWAVSLASNCQLAVKPLCSLAYCTPQTVSFPGSLPQRAPTGEATWLSHNNELVYGAWPAFADHGDTDLDSTN
ncbi:hypothetical protein FA13DRAFT_1735493 [Coprinellus micaceus]|uniref:Uncharacterized protein n=1 Tax=Coprinellus micaceus TaxID=71717 RepID=A0A4Y7T3B7_COPMI|nr:hypothetical protein FA13DRAFT_1735493 [Coprinellus micaceus]